MHQHEIDRDLSVCMLVGIPMTDGGVLEAAGGSHEAAGARLEAKLA